MDYNLLIGLMLLSFIIWLFMHLKDRRRILNGLWFIISLGSLFMVFIIIAILKDIYWMKFLIGLGLLLFLAMISISYLAFIITLFASGRTLIEREGLSFSNLLGILFGLGMIASSFASFLIRNLENHRFLRALVLFGNSYFVYFALGFFIYSASALVYNLYREKKNKDFLIVLGAGLNGDKVTPLLASRIDRAIDFYRDQIERTGKKAKFIMSGGQGADELVSEAEAMKNYALEQGIDEEDIICEDKSTSTEENLIFSSQIIDSFQMEKPKVLFFTNNYHVFRAALLAKSLEKDYNGLGSRTKLYFFIPAFIREYVAVLYMNLRANFYRASFLGLINFLTSMR